MLLNGINLDILPIILNHLNPLEVHIILFNICLFSKRNNIVIWAPDIKHILYCYIRYTIKHPILLTILKDIDSIMKQNYIKIYNKIYNSAKFLKHNKHLSFNKNLELRLELYFLKNEIINIISNSKKKRLFKNLCKPIDSSYKNYESYSFKKMFTKNKLNDPYFINFLKCLN